MPINILIVEDELIIAMDIKNNLEQKGYNVVNIATSCEKILETIENNDVDLILMDIVIKGEKDGIETAMIIKNKYNIPIVYISANIDTKTVERIKLTEPYGYVAKPVNNIQLEITIQLAFHLYQAHEKQIKAHNST